MEVYFRDKAGELKERSIKNKRYMIRAHILPYFRDKQMNTITPANCYSMAKYYERERVFSDLLENAPKSDHSIMYPCRQYLQLV